MHRFPVRRRGQRKSGGCSYEWWHDFNEKKANEQLRAHAPLKQCEVAYFLSRLDSLGSKEANGKTILENSMISTESGDGRHNDVKRDLSGIFHAVTGANGRFTVLMKDWQKMVGDTQPLSVEKPKAKDVRLDDFERKPDKWQPP